tara:strand:- start:368 stop:832 length:465 start_codon:yes stop_codon:yes gene_type:complete
MRNKIKRILKEGEFDWVTGSEGNEFGEYLHMWLGDWLDSNDITTLEEYIVEIPIGRQKDFIMELGGMFDNIHQSGRDEGAEEGREEGYDDGYDEGRDSGHTDGYDEGYTAGEETCEEKCEEKWQDGYDTGHNDGHSEGHQEGYSEAQDECEECD